MDVKDIRVKEANEMLKKLEEDNISNTLLGLVPLVYSIAITSTVIGIATSGLKKARLL